MTAFLIELNGQYLDNSSVTITSFTGTTGTSTITAAHGISRRRMRSAPSAWNR